MPTNAHLLTKLAKSGQDKQTPAVVYQQNTQNIQQTNILQLSPPRNKKPRLNQDPGLHFDFSTVGRVTVTDDQAEKFEDDGHLQDLITDPKRFIHANYKAYCLARFQLLSIGKEADNTLNFLQDVFDHAAKQPQHQDLFKHIAEWYTLSPEQKLLDETNQLFASTLLVPHFFQNPYLLHCFFPTKEQDTVTRANNRAFASICPICHHSGVLKNILQEIITSTPPAYSSKIGVHNIGLKQLVTHLQKSDMHQSKNKPFHEYNVKLHSYLHTVYKMLQTKHRDAFHAAIKADHKEAFPHLAPLQIPPAEDNDKASAPVQQITAIVQQKQQKGPEEPASEPPKPKEKEQEGTTGMDQD